MISLSVQPIEDVTSDNLICNTGLTHLSDTIISVTAGSTVTAEWHHTLSSEGDTSDSDEPIASSHKGPIITYLYVFPLIENKSGSQSYSDAELPLTTRLQLM